MVINMKCENELCIYESNGLCSLKEVELDIIGLCKDCIYIELNKDDLDSKKKAIIERLNKNG